MECKQAAQPVELEKAISYLRDVLARRPPSHPHRSDSLNDLANALLVRFWHAGQPRDLEAAIMLHGEAFKLRGNDLEAVIDPRDESQLLVRLLPLRLHSDHEPVNIPGWSGRSTT
jgi:hypothetical protein